MPKQPPLQPPQPAEPLPPGYRIISWIGEGQFGKVYRVRTPGGMRDAALKIVQLTRGASEGLKEFRSLDVIRGIKPHRNLLQYHSVWLRTQDGRFLDNADELDGADLEGSVLLIVMELADKTLADRLNECRSQVASDRPSGIPINELLIHIRQSARGLDHLHAEIHDLNGKLARVIHRDVKPANLLLFAGEVKVADYGVARAEVRDMKATQSISYTPAYAPPELYSNLPVPASDQYSLAVSYYELRTGCLPFSGFATPAHLLGALEFDLVPANEQEVLRRATSLVVGQRYPSCMSFADDLRAAVEWEVSIGAEMPDRRIAPVEPPPAIDPARITFHAAGSGTSRFKIPPELLVKRNEEPREDAPDEAVEDPHDIPTEPPAQSGDPDSPIGISNALVFTHLPQDQDSHLDGGPERPAEPTSRSGRLLHPPLRPQPSEVPAPGLTPLGPDSSDLVEGFFASTRSVVVPETAGNDDFRSTMIPTGAQPHHHQPRETALLIAEEIESEEIPASRTQKRHKSLKFLLLAVAIVIGMGIIAGALKPSKPIAVEEPPPVVPEIKKPTTTPPITPEPEVPPELHVQSVPPIPETAPPPRLKPDPIRLNPDPISPPPPPVDFAAKLKIARDTLNAGNLVNGLSLLDGILGHVPPPPKKVQREVEALRTAWKDTQKHNRNAATVTVEEVVLAAKCSIGDWAAKIEDRELLTDEDTQAVNAFYKKRFEGLIERFVRDPDPKIDWTQAKYWKDLKQKLDVVQAPSPWLELLRIECGLMEHYLLEEETIPEKLPKRDSGPETTGVEVYRAFVTATDSVRRAKDKPEDFRKAVDHLVETVGDVKVRALLNPARKQLVCQQLLEAEDYALRPTEKTEIDRPFGTDEADPRLARKWLEKAVLLGAANSRSVKKAKGRLLLAEASLVGGRAVVRDPLGLESPEDVAKALDSQDRSAFWLAYARTRDRKSQTSETLKGYEKAIEMVLANPEKLEIPVVFRRLAEVVLADEELSGVLAIAPADTKRRMSSLCASLARLLFRSRPLGGKKSDPLARVLAKLGERVSSLSNDPDLESLAGIIALECGEILESKSLAAVIGTATVEGNKNDRDKVKSELIRRENAARQWVDSKDGHVAPLVYLGIIRFELSVKEPLSGDKVPLLKQAAESLDKAVQMVDRPVDKTSLLPLIRFKAAIVNLHIANYLGEKYPRDVRTRLEAAFREAEELVGLVPDDSHSLDVRGCILEDQGWLQAGYSAEKRRGFYRDAVATLRKAADGKTGGLLRFDALLHLGRCRYKWANQFPEPDTEHPDPDEAKKQLLDAATKDLGEVRRDGRPEDQPEALYWLAMIEITRAGLPWSTATKNYPKDIYQTTKKLNTVNLDKAYGYLIELQKPSLSAETTWFKGEGADWLACLVCYQAKTADKNGEGWVTVYEKTLAALDRLTASAPLTAARWRTQYLYDELKKATDGSDQAGILPRVWGDFVKNPPNPALRATSVEEERTLLEIDLLRYRATAIQIAKRLPIDNAEKPLERILERAKQARLAKADIGFQLELAACEIFNRAATAGADRAMIAGLAARAFFAAEQLDGSVGYLSTFHYNLTTAATFRDYTAALLKESSVEDADKLYAQAETILANATDEEGKKKLAEIKLKRSELKNAKQ